MIKRILTGISAILILMPTSVAKIRADDGKTGLRRLVDEADAIAAIKILSTDYKATAGDGPMYAKAKVLKVLKGNVSTWWKLRFGETGWWEPTYKKGEYRLVFLGRKDLKDDYFKTKWRTIYTRGVDFFFAKDSLKDISRQSLSDFLTKTDEISGTSPKIEYSMARKDSTTRILSIKIINNGEEAFRLNPSKITVSYEANQIRYYREISRDDHEKDAWRKIEPASGITGSIYIKDEELKEESEIDLILSHFSVCFPYPCWIGAEYKKVNITTPPLLSEPSSKPTDAYPGPAPPKDTAQPEISDLNKAVHIGVAKLAEKVQAPAEYKLIGAQQIYHNGKYVWRITFKPTKLLPADPSAQLIGKGGEVFINIDLKTKETVITYGE